jgi:4-amino-4-deoxy-L-arabinose transferase-like glycosyltransferase
MHDDRRVLPRAIAAQRRVLASYRHGLVQGLLWLGLSLSLAGALTLGLALIYDPAAVLERIVEIELHALALSLLGASGWLAGRKAPLRRRVDNLLRAGAVLLLAVFMLARPESGLSPFPRFLLSPLFAGVALAGFVAGIMWRSPDRAAAVGEMRMWHTWAIVAIAVLVALPAIVRPLVTWWDISGYMDSHTYDHDAHRIATGEAPQGNGFVMPLYQYGMAVLYYAFGHFFAVQQVVNLLFALLTVALLVLTAWELFRDRIAVIVVAVLASTTTELRAFVTLTQIENWYVPIVAACLYAWARYRSRPIASRIAVLGLLVGIGLNCRTQGAFFFALLCLAPVFVARVPWRQRIAQVLIAGTVAGGTLIPWTLRNYVYEGRFSPASEQATIGLLFNHRNVGFYGLRWDLQSWQDVLAEYERTIPDRAARDAAIRRDALGNTFGDPAWLARAVYWRSLAFYGLLPPGIWAPDGPEPTNWAEALPGYVYYGFPSLCLITLSVFGLIRRPDRTTAFLALGILANLAVLVFASHTEARISFPVLPLHMLLAAAIFAPARSPDNVAAAHWRDPRRPRRLPIAVVAVAAVLLTLAFARMVIGREHAYRPLREPALLVSPSAYEQRRAETAAYTFVYGSRLANANDLPRPGSRIRLRVRLTNYMLPPKSAGAVPYLPRFATDPERETYYYAAAEGGAHFVGVTYFGAVAPTVVREGDLVMIEGRVLDAVPSLGLPLWIHAETVAR